MPQVDTDRDQASVLGGLQSWLGFAGSLGGADMANMANVGVDTSGIRSVDTWRGHVTLCDTCSVVQAAVVAAGGCW